MDVRPIAEGLGFPEGPVIMEDGSVVLVEVQAGRVSRVWGDGRRETVADTGGGPNGAAIGPDGALYVCNNGGLSFTSFMGLTISEGSHPDYSTGWIDRIELDGGRTERLYEACEGNRLNGPNDIVFDASGGFWFTDYGHHHGRTQDRGAVYYAKPDGSMIREARFPMFNPNGIGLLPGGRQVVVTETFTSRVWAIDVVGEGELAPALPTSPGTLLHGESRYRFFDSLAVLESGRVAVGTLVEGGITVVGDEREADFHPIADPLLTNIAFGGVDRRRAVMTASGTGQLLETTWSEPGLALAFGA